ncbi:MAG: sigma-70 family RNA polymerase sigma factor [Bacteroidales bacterium]|nr:sigma-70 family RNA polymerase sigma factor [Bacteroidales bacterium]
MRRMAVLILHDDELAADAVQETLARLWHRRWRLDMMKNPQGFCMNSLRNHCIDTLRRGHHSRLIDSTPQELLDFQPSESPSTTTEERYQRLENAIASLPPQQRQLIHLKYVEQRNSREIAQITGLTEGNVNTILSRTYAELRKYLTRED